MKNEEVVDAGKLKLQATASRSGLLSPAASNPTTTLFLFIRRPLSSTF